LADGSANLLNRLRAVAVTQERSTALTLVRKAMMLFARSHSFAFGFVGQVEDLQMSSSAVDIAWISCGPNTLSSGGVLPS